MSCQQLSLIMAREKVGNTVSRVLRWYCSCSVGRKQANEEGRCMSRSACWVSKEKEGRETMALQASG